MESPNDKLSIKNILFSKIMPSYAPNVPTNDHKLYVCIDCGDKYIFKSSYEYHINRKSLKITYMCRICHQVLYFYNRCRLLFHIRSHAFKSHTINVSDLKIEPLPLSEYNITAHQTSGSSNLPVPATTTSTQESPPKAPPIKTAMKPTRFMCFECKEDITSSGTMFKDRRVHYTKKSQQKFQCIICKLEMSTSCAFAAHWRLHRKTPPFICPECGCQITAKTIEYPFSHACAGFKLMRAAARVKCPMDKCRLFHPSEYMKHLMTHVKKAYKCSKCTIACFTRESIQRHLKKHNGDQHSFMIFYQCEICPGRLVLSTQLDNHLKTHAIAYVYPCWSCGISYKTAQELLNHHKSNCGKGETVKSNGHINEPRAYRVVKKCDKCERSFTYKCQINEIDSLPIECPFGCSPNSNTVTGNEKESITCRMCTSKVPNDWETIKKHLAEKHSQYKGLDVKVVLQKLDVSKFLKPLEGKITKKPKRSKRRGKEAEKPEFNEVSIKTDNDDKIHKCHKCKDSFSTITELSQHYVQHRDPCTAYQCLECGECYVVKPSFATHLLLEHDIQNVDEYVKVNKCFNAEALSRWYQKSATDGPVNENQCSICREQFNNHDDLEKHFRQHGMAFLLRKSKQKAVPDFDQPMDTR